MVLSAVATVKECVSPNGDLSAVPDEDCARVEIVVAGHAEVVDAAFLGRCKRLKVVVRAGMGYERIDVAAASEAGVLVCSAPDYGVEEVADTALAHILCLYRRTTFLMQGLRDGVEISNDEQLISRAAGCRRVRESTLGLIGLGKVGIAVAQRAKSFGMQVVYYDPFAPLGLDRAIGGLDQMNTLEDLVRISDCVSIHCPLTPSNHHLVNEPLLRLFKKTAFLVNTARGGLIDEDALASALREGRLAGAALDVFEKEPFVYQGSVFEGLPNVLVTPHCAWYSPESFDDCYSTSRKCVRAAIESCDPTQVPNGLNYQNLNTDSCKVRWDKNLQNNVDQV
jgi:C-terminal binding protein